jgi:hypothetical protein
MLKIKKSINTTNRNTNSNEYNKNTKVTKKKKTIILNRRETLLMKPIKKFFYEKDNIDIFFNILKGDSEDSLRLYEWFVVNYSKKYDIRYNIKDNEGINNEFVVHLNYKSQLQSYSKKYFDAFCRTKRIFISNYNGIKEETTIGQLNFFKWAISNKIIEYIKKHRDDINKDMIHSLRHLYNNKDNKIIDKSDNDKNNINNKSNIVKKKKRRTRKELSISATKKINKHDVKIIVSFN